MTPEILSLRALRLKLQSLGYAGLTERERVMLAYGITATANVVIPRGLEDLDR